MATGVNRRERLGSREWANEAVRRIAADENRSADTHLHTFPLPPQWGIDLYLKDESVHPTGSLKHRLARSLFLYGLCNGWITEHTAIVDVARRLAKERDGYFLDQFTYAERATDWRGNNNIAESIFHQM